MKNNSKDHRGDSGDKMFQLLEATAKLVEEAVKVQCQNDVVLEDKINMLLNATFDISEAIREGFDGMNQSLEVDKEMMFAINDEYDALRKIIDHCKKHWAMDVRRAADIVEKSFLLSALEGLPRDSDDSRDPESVKLHQTQVRTGYGEMQ